MPIESVRASLSGDALKDFDTILSKFRMTDNVDYTIHDFIDENNFIVKSVFFKDCNPVKTLCYWILSLNKILW